MDNIQQPRLAEKITFSTFNFLGSFWPLIAFCILGLLYFVSITYNFNYGQKIDNLSDGENLGGLAYASLQVAAIFLAAVGFSSAWSVRKVVSLVWCSVLVCISIWIGMSNMLSKNTEVFQINKQKQIQRLEKDLEAARETVATAQYDYKNTTNNETRMKALLDKAKADRDAISEKLAAIEEKTPAAEMAINYKASALLYKLFQIDITPDEVFTFVLLIVSFAIDVTPFVVTSVLAAMTMAFFNSLKTKNKSEPVKPAQLDFAGENSAESKKWWGENVVKFGRKTEKTAQSKQIPISDGKQGKITACERSIQKVVSWLATQHGRVNRGQIKSKCSNRDYENVSAVIKEIEKRGYIKRNGNGHTIVNRAKFDKEGAA